MSDPSFISFYDFHYLWAAGKIALDGANVYDQHTLSLYLSRTAWPTNETAQALSHPPTALLLYIPFALLPFGIAAWLWCILSVVLVGFACWFQIKLIAADGDTLDYLRIYQGAFVVVLFPPLFSTLILGQNNAFLLFGISLFVYSVRLGRPVLAGVALSLTALKPHLFIPFYIVLFSCSVYPLRPTLYILLGFTGSMLLQIFVAHALYPHGFENYVSAIGSLIPNTGAYQGASLAQIFSTKFGIKSAPPIFLSFGILIGLVAALKKKASNSLLMSIILPISLLTSPYVWPHAFLVLLPPYLEMTRHWFASSEMMAKIKVLGLALLGILDVVRPLQFGFLLVIIPIWIVIHSISSMHRQT